MVEGAKPTTWMHVTFNREIGVGGMPLSSPLLS